MDRTSTKRVPIGESASITGLQGLDDLEWELRYGDPNDVRFLAASIVSDYRALIQMTQRRRNEVCEAIKNAEVTNG